MKMIQKGKSIFKNGFEKHIAFYASKTNTNTSS